MRKFVSLMGIVTLIATVCASTATAQAVEPLYSRCMSVPPICTPGTHPFCICESDISYNCKWICASH